MTIEILGVDSQAYPEVTVLLAARAGDGHLAGLTADDFKIAVEDEVQDGAGGRSSSVVAVTPEPLQDLQLVLALDTSMPAADLAALKAAAWRLISEGLSGYDRLMILGFSNGVNRPLPNFTNNTKMLEEALNKLGGGGEKTALLQAIIEAAEVVGQAPAGRKAVILITDRHDNAGIGSLAGAIEMAQEVQAPFYIIGFGDSVQPHHDLKAQIGLTGGRYLTVGSAGQVEAALQGLHGELKQGYKLTLSSGLAVDDQPHRFTVSLNQQGRQVEGQGEFIARRREVGVKLPALPAEPQVRGLIHLAPEIEAVGDVISVSYLLDDRLLAEQREAPYGYTWDSTKAEPGAHTLTVKVMDHVGNEGRASATLNLAHPVEVSIPTAPPAPIEYGRLITIEATIQPEQEDLRVELLLNDQLLASHEQPPYIFELDSKDFADLKVATLTIRAEDQLGQADQESLRLEFLPKPPELTWVQQLGQNLGFAPAGFEQGLNRGFDLLMIGLAGLLILFALLLAAAQLNQIKARHRLACQKRCLVEVANEGNVASQYELRAQDENGSLNFQFILNEPALSHPPTPSGTGPGPNPTAVASKPNPAPKPPSITASRPIEPKVRNGQQPAAQPQASRTDILGGTLILARIMGMIGQLLPGFLGQPFRTVSSQLSTGRSAVQRVTQVPRQIGQRVSRLGQEVSRFGPGVTGPSGTGPAPSPTGQRLNEPARASSSPVNEPILSGASSLPEANATAKLQPKTTAPRMPAVSNPIRTPLLASREILLLDLIMTPRNPYLTKIYPLTIITSSVEQNGHQPTWLQETIEFTAISGYRRYRPVALVVLGVGLVALAVAFATAWLVRFEVVTWLTALGQHWLGLP